MTYFGRRYFAARFFGGPYFGIAAGSTSHSGGSVLDFVRRRRRITKTEDEEEEEDVLVILALMESRVAAEWTPDAGESEDGA